MKEIKQIIKDNNPTVIINGQEQDLEMYIEKSDYTNNMLHSYYYSESRNSLSISFISEYAMKKITGRAYC